MCGSYYACGYKATARYLVYDKGNRRICARLRNRNTPTFVLAALKCLVGYVTDMERGVRLCFVAWLDNPM